MRQTKFTTAELKKDLLQVPIQHIVSVLWIAYTLRTLGAALSNSKIWSVFPHQPWRRFMAFKKTTKNQVPEVQLAWEQHTALSNNFQTQWDLPKQLILWQSNTAMNNAICRSILFWERRAAFCNAMLDFRRTMNLWEQHAFFVPSTSGSPSKKW